MIALEHNLVIIHEAFKEKLRKRVLIVVIWVGGFFFNCLGKVSAELSVVVFGAVRFGQHIIILIIAITITIAFIVAVARVVGKAFGRFVVQRGAGTGAVLFLHFLRLVHFLGSLEQFDFRNGAQRTDIRPHIKIEHEIG